MTESEAIEKLKNMRLFMQIIDKNSEHKFAEDDYKTNDMAIQALEEVQQYREIGTLEECRTAREKQILKKPYHISQVDDNDNAKVECPSCHATADYAVNVIKRGHCWKCGQLLDWSDEK